VRTWFSLIAIVAAVVYVQPAWADKPADVYSDFATDGVLNCGHSRSALTGILNDASLNQYGDPLTILLLKLEIQRQLARGCQRRLAATDPGDSAEGESDAPGTESKKDPDNNPPRELDQNQQDERGTAQSDEVQQGGAMVILGAGLLLLALGSGGWAAKRAFTK
jgi:hypothetical protein